MRFTLQRPDLGKVLAGSEKAVERAVTAGMRQASDSLKASLRQDVVSAGLGDRLARMWRGTTYPQAGDSLEAAAFVWSRAPKLVDAFDRGAVIRSTRGFWLAIPTPAAGAAGRTSAGRPARITPGGWERRTGLRLRFVYRRGRPSLLVAENVRVTSKGVAAPTVDGFEYAGRPWKSLSAIARAIAGTRWNGPAFFGLRSGRRAAR